MRNSHGVIEIDNYVILSTLQNFHFLEYTIFVYRFGPNKAETNIALSAKYLRPILC